MSLIWLKLRFKDSRLMISESGLISLIWLSLRYKTIRFVQYSIPEILEIPFPGHSNSIIVSKSSGVISPSSLSRVSRINASKF